MPYQITRLFNIILLALCIGIGNSACTNTPQRQHPIPAFPPQSAEPKLIYDGTLRSSKDITSITFTDKLKQVATGVIVDPFGLAKPYGVVAHQGRVYVTDTQQRAILMFDIKEKVFKMFGIEGKGAVTKPLGIDISPAGEIFVADITAKRIFVYDLEGNFLRTLGNDKLFNRPTSVTTAKNKPVIYVVDTGGIDSDAHHVLVLDAATGKHLHTIGKRGAAPGEFNLPLQASTAPDGTLYIVDSGNFRVQAFSNDYQFLKTFGSLGRKSGNFSRPKGIATDNQGNIYIVDTAFGNFQIFNPQGKLLLFVGTRATSGGPAKYMLPAGIDVDEEGRVYIVDQFFRKVDIFRPPHLPPLQGIPTV